MYIFMPAVIFMFIAFACENVKPEFGLLYKALYATIV